VNFCDVASPTNRVTARLSSASSSAAAPLILPYRELSGDAARFRLRYGEYLPRRTRLRAVTSDAYLQLESTLPIIRIAILGTQLPCARSTDGYLFSR